MSGSLGTYQDRIGKFIAGDVLINNWGDYDPGNPLITTAGSTAFIAAVEAANTNVVITKNAVGIKQDARKLLCFTIYDPNKQVGINNPNCAEERIVRVHSYLAGMLPEDSPTVDAIAAILKKIRPRYRGATGKKSYSVKKGQTIAISNVISGEPAKNTGNTTLEWQEAGSAEPPVSFAPRQETVITAPSGHILVKNPDSTKGGRIRLVIKTGKKLTKSPSERTFASISGFLSEVITLAEGIAAPPGYNPPDPALAVAELIDLHDEIVAANRAVTTAMNAYSTDNRTRKTLYDGAEGMQERIRLTKSYLASFRGGKKSDHFIEYSQALKGT